MKMKWLIGCLFILCGIHSPAQEKTLSVDFKDLPLEIILDSISLKADINFSYNAEILPPGSLYTYSRKSVNLHDLLNALLVGTGLEFIVENDQYIIRHERQNQPTPAIKDDLLDIQGWVRELDSKSPVEGAIVYINGSTLGAVTDDHGNYRINNVKPGNYMLVFSHLGYKTATYMLDGEKNRRFTVNALMEIRVQQLQDVEVVSERLINKAENARFYRIFQRELLGTSLNSSGCDILNPEVLDYNYNSNWDFLDVQALKPLEILNSGLGYKVWFDLDYFTKDQEEINFHGTARFEDLKPESNSERKKWKRNREKAYYGSLNHFFKALVADKLNDEGYVIASVKNDHQWDARDRERIEPSEIISKGVEKGEYILSFDDLLFVEYLNEIESTQFLEAVRSNETNFRSRVFGINHQEPSTQKSMIRLKSDSLVLNRQGQATDLLDIVTYGYWSWERLADFMPIDYDPKTDNL